MDNFHKGQEITNNIVSFLIKHDYITDDFEERKGDSNVYAMKASIHPMISNAMYQREKEVREQERLLALINLSKGIDDTGLLFNLVTMLGYKVESTK